MKRCPRCKRDDRAFGKDISTKDGMARWCKPCSADGRRASKAKRPKMSEIRARSKVIAIKNAPKPSPEAAEIARQCLVIDHVASTSAANHGYPTRLPAVFRLYAKYRLSPAEIADVFSVTEARIRTQLDECQDVLKPKNKGESA